MSVNQVQSNITRIVSEETSSHPSLCIPRVFQNITRERIIGVFSELNLGEIHHIDMIRKTNEKGESFNRVFVHFRQWWISENAVRARQRILSGKEIKIIYDDPWFWKVSENKVHQRPMPTMQFCGDATQPFANQQFVQPSVQYIPNVQQLVDEALKEQLCWQRNQQPPPPAMPYETYKRISSLPICPSLPRPVVQRPVVQRPVVQRPVVQRPVVSLSLQHPKNVDGSRSPTCTPPAHSSARSPTCPPPAHGSSHSSSHSSSSHSPTYPPPAHSSSHSSSHSPTCPPPAHSSSHSSPPMTAEEVWTTVGEPKTITIRVAPLRTTLQKLHSNPKHMGSERF